FVGGNYDALVDRADILQSPPNLYLRRPVQQRQNASANYRKLIYELDQNGARALRQYGIDIPRLRQCQNFGHELMNCCIAASLDLGCSEHVRIIPWRTLLA